MQRPSLRIIIWSLRLISIGILFWWPALLRDPIYTPRHMRMTGQEFHLPTRVSLPAHEEEDARAFAIFWGWEHRSLVSTRWLLGPYHGIRAPEGRMQTLIALLLFWGAGSLALSRWNSSTSPTLALPRQRGVLAWLSTPLWQWFARRR